MTVFNLSKIAVKAMARNKMRTFLTMLGIIIGVTSVITMLAIGQGSKQSIQEQISSMGANMIMVHPGSDMRGGVRMDPSSMKSLTLDDLSAIRRYAAQLSALSPMVSSGGQVIAGGSNWPTTIQGVGEDFLMIRKMEVAEGVMFTDYEVKRAAKVCLLGQTVAENLFPDVEDVVGQTVRFKNIPLKVIGVLAAKGQNTFGQDQDDVILAPYTTIQKRIMAITHIQSIYASAESEGVSEQAEKEITMALRASHSLADDEEDDFNVRSQQELINTFSSTSEMLTLLLGAIAGISLLVGGIGIMNIMFVSVTERTREIGLRLAVGGRGRDILSQFLMEAVIVSVGGGLFGVLLGLALAYGMGNMLDWPVVVTNQSIVISFVVCAVVGIFFGWYPARKAAGLDPIEALRYE
ncbi:putative ABC transport system permease protein [Marinilabilia salmonicolor]|jgi:putative ABC transport system permease protein|uniref:ABC transporter permease n=1 Tax=Marinilabilia salmonicolor TaxID=989 RepID=UPI000D0563E1|nr:ABC transporter permease [Marinilabilia salmonicolor]PRZ01719.1 putative ABC transport system permease protein [Marinilabilia salmonicolor]